MIKGKIQEREECGHKPAAHRLQNEVGLELIKVGLVKTIPEVLTELGLDTHLLLTAAGICPETFNDPENVIPLRALCRLLSESAKRSRCEHVGLLIGQRTSIPGLGLVGLLLEHSTCVHDALQNLARYVHLQDGCGITILTVANHTARLGYRILEIALPGAFEFVDAVMASRFNIMRRLCGRPWHPIEVTLPRAKPRDTRHFINYFGAPVQFGREQGVIHFSSDCLTSAVSGANPVIRELIEEQLIRLDSQAGGSFKAKLRRFIRMLVLTKKCSLESTARLFGIAPRSLARRLSREKIEFRQLLEETRYEIARQLIANPQTPLDEVAAILGYSEASAFTRAFRRWSGTTPRSWRAEHYDQNESPTIVGNREMVLSIKA